MKAATTSLQTDRDLRSRRVFHAWALTGLVLVLGLAALSASAQGVYRIVGPDGRVTYSDQPPPAAKNDGPDHQFHRVARFFARRSDRFT